VVVKSTNFEQHTGVWVQCGRKNCEEATRQLCATGKSAELRNMSIFSNKNTEYLNLIFVLIRSKGIT